MSHLTTNRLRTVRPPIVLGGQPYKQPKRLSGLKQRFPNLITRCCSSNLFKSTDLCAWPIHLPITWSSMKSTVWAALLGSHCWAAFVLPLKMLPALWCAARSNEKERKKIEVHENQFLPGMAFRRIGVNHSKSNWVNRSVLPKCRNRIEAIDCLPNSLYADEL